MWISSLVPTVPVLVRFRGGRGCTSVPLLTMHGAILCLQRGCMILERPSCFFLQSVGFFTLVAISDADQKVAMFFEHHTTPLIEHVWGGSSDPNSTELYEILFSFPSFSYLGSLL